MIKRFFSTTLFLLFIATAATAQLNKPTALIKGEVRTPEGKPVNGATVQVYRAGDKMNSSRTNDGKFQVVLQQAGEYKILITEASHYAVEYPVSIPTLDKYQEIPVSISMRTLELGSAYPFSSPVFEPGSSTVSSEVSSDLDKIASQLKRNNKLRVTATVYPDEIPTGKKLAEQSDLATARKNSLAGFFLGKGLNSMSVAITISNAVPAGQFDRTITVTEEPKKGKKKAKKPVSTSKNVKVPQTAEIIMNLNS